MGKKIWPEPDRAPMTFDELCLTFRVTEQERDRLAWHLGTIRMRNTYERLRSGIGIDVLRQEPAHDRPHRT